MAEPRCYTIHVSAIPPGLNARLHPLQRWRTCKGLGNEVAYQAAALVASHGWHHPFAHAAIVATITQRSRRYTMDTDNAYACIKPLVDPLIGRLIVDDSPAHITLEVRQQVGTGRGVHLDITEVMDDEHAD